MTTRPRARPGPVTAVCLAAAPVAALATLTAPAGAATLRTRPSPAAPAASAAKVDCAAWQQDCQAVMDQAPPYLRQRLAAARPGEKQAIVFDIDNTTDLSGGHAGTTYELPDYDGRLS